MSRLLNDSANALYRFYRTAKDLTEMLNLKTGKHFNAPRCDSSRQTGSEEAVGHILHGSQMTRGGFLKGILASGIAPSITLATIANAGSANATIGGMMRNVGARNAAMFGGSKPYDYEVEWIKSDGNCWIDSGVQLTEDLYVNASFDSSNDIFDACILGFEEGTSYAIRMAFRLKDQLMAYINGYYQQALFNGILPFRKHELTIDATNGAVIADNVVRYFSFYPSTWTYIIFAQNYNSRTNIVQKSKSSCSKFYAKLADDIVRDFIPVVATFNGVKEPCFYNRAYNGDDAHGLQFYRNLGSGTLTAGPRV